MFAFRKKKSTDEAEFDFTKMMRQVRQDPQHLEQVQQDFKKYTRSYPRPNQPVSHGSGKDRQET
ncbi:hypothetical protein ACFQHW_05745 [Lapidilactobacillus achengensis]|uniref:Uncharacterized protein n=1 Tax=Lapidilactobacillus achengensis TaxID=2486000 RepID=A0ABW1UQM2_9LACO|nr:hypothetical protein [Lapidilactobacillus achengensis]